MPQFKIEQLAICVNHWHRDKAIALLRAIGLEEWITDNVIAHGTVHGQKGSNGAQLNFNYDAFAGKELELLAYTSGINWMNRTPLPAISHLGMHCDAAALVEWRELFDAMEIDVVQEVFTESHTNPAIAGKRTYNYVIFGTRHLIGTDLKFIVRIDK